MLGTPNHGSFAIPLTLTGAEKLVKLLIKADLHHGKDELLAILGTFPGLYDMLPSPFVEARRRPPAPVRRSDVGPGSGKRGADRPRELADRGTPRRR